MARVFRQPELERRIQERIWVRIAKSHQFRIRRELAKQYNDAADAVGKGRVPYIKTEGLATSMTYLMRDGYQQIGQRAAYAIQDAQGRGQKRAIPMEASFERGLNSYIRTHAGRKVTEVTDTTKARIAKLTQAGIDQGLTLPEVAASIRQAGLIESAFRAEVIARTESHSAANAGSLESARASEVVQEKEWIFTEDERTRNGENSEFDHTHVDNVGIDEPFMVSGEELMFPGDPSGSAGNVIQCRCAMGYVV